MAPSACSHGRHFQHKGPALYESKDFNPKDGSSGAGDSVSSSNSLSPQDNSGLRDLVLMVLLCVAWVILVSFLCSSF